MQPGNRGPEQGRTFRIDRSRAALIALLAIGAVVRVGGAWLFRHADNSDQGIVALMAKHIAEGRPFPVFFYGQAYMGSLEPAVSALLCRLFGYSGFAVCLGTALFGFLLLPVVYVLGRDIAGRAAGLAALAFCIVGPVGYFHYLHSPRGGYAVTVLLGVLLPWYGGRLALRHRAEARAPLGGYFLLGLLAGLGWWSNQLIAAALLATGLLVLLVLARRALGWHVVVAGGGFALGSLPFWVWNLRHDWATFGLAKSLGAGTFLAGLRALLTERLPAIFNAGAQGRQAAAGMGAAPLLGALGGWLTAGILAAAVAVTLARYLRHLRRPRWSPETVQTTGLLLLVLASLALASASSYALLNTPRYLLPLVPVFGVFAGVAAASASRQLKWGSAFLLPLLLVIGWHAALTYQAFSAKYREQEHIFAQAQVLGADLRAAGVGVVYVPFVNHVLNSLLREEFVFCDIKGERYPPYAERAEASDEIAVLSNYGYAVEFVSAAGGSFETAGTGGFAFVHRFRPPSRARAEVPPALWSAARELEGGGDVLSPLTDGDASTAWQARHPAAEPATVEISFAAPVALSGVRLLVRGQFPAKSWWEIQGRAGPGAPWQPVAPAALVTQYHWSGPRPYFGGGPYRLEARFPTATVAAVRIALRLGGPTEVEVLEAHAFTESGADAVPEPRALPALREILGARGISRLFCDRWVANAVRRQPGNTVETPEERGILTTGKSVEHRVGFAPGTGLLAREEDAGACRRTLAASGVAMRETAVGPWVLFDFAPGGPGGWLEEYRGRPPLLWAGVVCLRP